MFNQVFIVGKIDKIPDLNCKNMENILVLEVKRNYKNVEGVFDKDYFSCYLWSALCKKINVSCKIGDVIALRGRLINDREKSACNILAEQVILLNKAM